MRKYIKDEQILKLCDDFIDAFGEKGLGLGSETSQLNAITYPNRIDHYIKEVARIKTYGRYMDDSYLIHHDKKVLIKTLEQITKFFDDFGIIVNKKKTLITDLKHGFTFLKTRFFLTETGKIIKKPCRCSITRERRKLKKQAKLVENGVLTLADVEKSYQSWRGSMKYRTARKTVYNMDLLFKKLFLTTKKENQT